MSTREFVILGTASQVPTARRNHNGYFLRWDQEGILFDPGEGTQRQMIYTGLAASDITRILITHFHGDHCLGLAGIIQRLSLDDVKHPIHIYYPLSGQVFYERLRHASIFFDRCQIIPHPIKEDGIICETEEFTIEAQSLMHAVDCFGFRLLEKTASRIDKELLATSGVCGPMVRDLINDGEVTIDGKVIRYEDVSYRRPGQSFAFVMDTKLCDNAFSLAKGVDLLVCEATFLSSEEELARLAGHLTAQQAGRIAHESGARKLVLTHFSQRYQDLRPFEEEALELHDDVVVARDKSRVEMPKRNPADQKDAESPAAI